MEKRGSISFLAGVIIVLVSFFAVGGVVGYFATKMSDKEAENLCHDSIIFRAKSTLNVGGTEIKVSPPFCKTIDKEFSGSREEVMRTFSELASRCWWMWGEGRYEEIMQSKKIWEILGLSASNPCFVCYTVALDESKDFKEGTFIFGQELNDFAYSTTYKKLGNETYLQYLTYSRGPGRLLTMAHLQPGHAYGIAFAPKNKEDVTWYGAAAKIGGGLALAVVGAVGTVYTAGASVPLAIAGGTAVAAGATALFGSGVANVYKLQTERDVSTIYIDELKSLQGYCYSGDLAGE